VITYKAKPFHLKLTGRALSTSLRRSIGSRKQMKHSLFLISVLACVNSVSAQDFMPFAGGAFAYGSPYRMACPDSTNGFTAKIIVENGEDSRMLPMTLRQFGTKMSAELKFTDYVPAEEAKREAPSLGIDDLFVVMDIHGTNVWIVFPELRAFIDSVAPLELVDALRQLESVHLDKVVLGNEPVDGAQCEKSQFPDPRGPKVTVTMWQRPDLHNFPMKIEFRSKRDVMRTVTKSVEFSKPSMTYFEAPASFRRCTNSAELMLFARKSLKERTQ
jgi:hypothetical protein